MDTIKSNTESRGRERGVLKVPSRSNPSTHHYVDVKTQSCSCKGFSYRGECRHLRLVNAPIFTVHEVHDSRVPALRYDIYGREGWEGRCISFAEAYEVVTVELGGVLGEPGTGGYYGLAAV